MKSAQHHDNQYRTASAPRPETNRRRPVSTSSDLGTAIAKLGKILVQILTFPIQLLTWLTRPPGSAIVLGLAVLYFVLVNIEGYWQSMPSFLPKLAFLPKPFIEDGGNLGNLYFALGDSGFYIAAIVSMVIQAVQALILREASAEKAKADYEAVARYEVPEKNDRAIDLAELRRQQYKKVGMRTARAKGAIILLVYGVDGAIAFWNYPLTGLPSAGQLAINLVWAVLSIFGAELAINMFLDALQHAKENRRPHVEVL